MLADQKAMLELNNVKEANQDDHMAKLEPELDTQRKETEQMLKSPLGNHNEIVPIRDNQVDTDESNNVMDTTNRLYQLPAHAKHEKKHDHQNQNGWCLMVMKGLSLFRLG